MFLRWPVEMYWLFLFKRVLKVTMHFQGTLSVNNIKVVMKFFILLEFWLNSNVENVEKFFANLVFKQFCKWVKTDI